MNGAAILDAPLRDAGDVSTTLRAYMGEAGLVAVFVRHYG